ncbi:hypothetical protein R6K74_12815, partial [Enterococcus faecium]|uniref:hypothetical protein n=1 Tax=Enterococcus faecium TaxID=1352 RepID=UPI00296B1CB7
DQEELIHLISNYSKISLYQHHLTKSHINRLKSLFLYFFNLLHTLFNIDIYTVKHAFHPLSKYFYR